MQICNMLFTDKEKYNVLNFISYLQVKHTSQT
jgi:hypothetical protein